jgi:ketosteroid isomerase-like protein
LEGVAALRSLRRALGSVRVGWSRKGDRVMTTETDATLALVRRFGESWNRHDVEAIMADMTDDAVYENLGPPESSGCWEGQAAVRAEVEAIFDQFPDCRFDTDDIFAAGNRCSYSWTLHWTEADGSEGAAQGTDVYTVRDGKIAYKKTYE